MPHTAYPIGSDLSAYLILAGFDAAYVATLDLTNAALAGYRAFEQATGRRMLATTQTRQFDRPRHCHLNLKADLLTVSSFLDGTTALVANTDYRLEPLNAADDDLPYTRVFLWRRYGYSAFPVSLAPRFTIAGNWGYGTSIPEDAWQAMLAAASLYLLPLITQQRSGGMEAWTEADMSERYGSDPLMSLRTSWTWLLLGTAGGLDPKTGKRLTGTYTRVESLIPGDEQIGW